MKLPNIWTHMIYGEQVAKKAGISFDASYQNVFRFGCQGPDPFFYYNFWPWKKEKAPVRIGGMIHKQNCGTFLLKMLQYAKESQDKLLQAYVLGFVAHHLLDRNAHPYIIYKSGEEGNKHQLLENIIDTLILKKYHGLDTWKKPVYKEIEIGKLLPHSIRKMLTSLIKEIHQVEDENLEQIISKSYQDMILALKVLFDPTGIKHKLLRKQIEPFSYSKHIPDKDYLNLQKTEWYHPADLNEKSNESFYEIFDRALNEGLPLFKEINQYFHGQDNLASIEKLLSNISYETGKDCSFELEHRYFDPII